MAGWEMKILTAEAHRLLKLAAEDADLRAELRALAQEILATTEAPPPDAEAAPQPPSSGAEQTPPAGGGAPPDPMTHGVSQDDRGSEPEPLRELTLGRRAPAPSRESPAQFIPSRPETDEDELRRIEARCRAKAEAARRVAERQRRICEGTDLRVEDAPIGPEFSEWADRLTDCFYWLDDDTSHPADPSLLDQVGGCFEALAGALTLVAGGKGHRGAMERALPLVAEAQSAVRRALRRLDAPDDPDQVAAYEWVRATAARNRIYLRRHLRADDLADPARWPDLLARIEAVAAGSQPPQPLGPQVERARTHLAPIREGRGTDRDWRAVIEAVEEIVGQGVPPSHREVRDLLLPVLDDLPDREDLPPGFRRVLREIDRFLATRTPTSGAGIAPEPTAEVREAARLMGGSSVVLIGGMRRPEAQASLRRALGLKDLIWVETKEHQAIGAFEPAIARPDLVLVLLAIRWSSHAFGEVKHTCDQHGKPLVRLPGGYSPNQVASQILSQCGQRLGGE